MLELYHNNISVCSQKVRLVLAEKNVPWVDHHLDLINGQQFTPEYRQINPRAVVPALVHDGKAVIESTVIDEYLDDTFPDPPLKAPDPYDRAQMRLWCRVPDDGLHVACMTVSFAGAFGRQLAASHTPEQLEARLNKMPDPVRRERQRQIIQMGFDAPSVKDQVKFYDKTIGDMEETLARSPWLAGATFSLADISMVPYIERIDRLKLAGLWAQRPHVADWLARMKARPSFSAISDYPPRGYDDRVNDSDSAWPRVKAILATA